MLQLTIGIESLSCLSFSSLVHSFSLEIRLRAMAFAILPLAAFVA